MDEKNRSTDEELEIFQHEIHQMKKLHEDLEKQIR